PHVFDEAPAGGAVLREARVARKRLVARPDPDRRQGAVKVAIGRAGPGHDVAFVARTGARLPQRQGCRSALEVRERLRRIVLQDGISHADFFLSRRAYGHRRPPALPHPYDAGRLTGRWAA